MIVLVSLLRLLRRQCGHYQLAALDALGNRAKDDRVAFAVFVPADDDQRSPGGRGLRAGSPGRSRKCRPPGTLSVAVISSGHAARSSGRYHPENFLALSALLRPSCACHEQSLLA